MIVVACLVALLVGGLLGRLTAPRLPVIDDDDVGPHRIERTGAVEVRRYGSEVDEVVVDDYAHLEVMSQPHADEPRHERYAHVSLIIERDGQRVNVALTSDAPIVMTVLQPVEVACRG